MRRTNLFLAVIIASLASLVILVVVGMYVFGAAQQSPYYWMGRMWSGGTGGMMGGNQPSIQNPALPFFGLAFIILVGVTIVGVAGLAYYFVVPEIKTGSAPTVCEPVPKGSMQREEKAPCTPLESVLKTMTEDERKVVDVLAAHDGKYLQKYIRSEAGLNRLQTHRIVARLAQRGIVMLEKTGNTNQVLLADWLKN